MRAFRSPLVRLSAVAVVAALGDQRVRRRQLAPLPRTLRVLRPRAQRHRRHPGTAAGTGTELPAAELSLVAYSTPQEAYEKIINAFKATPCGKNITFTQSYRRIRRPEPRRRRRARRPTIVAFSLEPDVTRLVKEGLVADDWNKDTHAGNVTDSVVVLVVRKGNPKNIKSWADLTKPGIEVITAEPVHIGRCSLERDGRLRPGDQGRRHRSRWLAYLHSLFKHVPVQDDSARKSLQTFTSGKGDVLLAYENEAIFAQQKGQDIDYVVPDSTILIENPAAVTRRRSTLSRPRRSSTSFTRRKRRRSSPRTGTDRDRRRRQSIRFPDAVRAVHHRRPRRLDRRDEEVLRSEGQRHGGRGGRHRSVGWLTQQRRCAQPTRSADGAGLRRAQRRHRVRRRAWQRCG